MFTLSKKKFNSIPKKNSNHELLRLEFIVLNLLDLSQPEHPKAFTDSKDILKF